MATLEKEKATLVKLEITTPCEYHRVKRGQPACKRPATVGYLFHVSGRLGRCYCEEHAPTQGEN